MTGESIAIFLYVAETRSISAAAEQVHASKQMISQAILSLEQELDVRLISHDRNPVALTAAGEHYRRFFTEELDRLEYAAKKVKIRYDEAREILIAVDHWAGGCPAVTDALRQYDREHHHRLICLVDEKQNMVEMLRDDRVDAVIATRYSMRPIEDMFRVTPLGELPLCYVIASDRTTDRADPWESAADVPILTTHLWEPALHDVTERERELCEGIGFRPPEIRIFESSADVAANLYLGTGAAIQPQGPPDSALRRFPTGRTATLILACRESGKRGELRRLTEIFRERLEVPPCRS